MSSTSTSRSTSRPAAWDPQRVRFFPTRADLREWFEAHHADAGEIWVGFYKAHTGRVGATYADAVEEALCFGWIDTTVRRIDEDRYANRFVPRRPDSSWTPTNRALFRELERRGLVNDAGRIAFSRSANRSPPEGSETGPSRRRKSARRRRPGSS